MYGVEYLSLVSKQEKSMFNEQQVLSAVRWVMATLGSFLVTHGWMDQGFWEPITGLVLSGVPFAWSMFRHTRVGTLIAAAEVPGTEKIVNPPLAADTPSSKVVAQ